MNKIFTILAAALFILSLTTQASAILPSVEIGPGYRIKPIDIGWNSILNKATLDYKVENTTERDSPEIWITFTIVIGGMQSHHQRKASPFKNSWEKITTFVDSPLETIFAQETIRVEIEIEMPEGTEYHGDMTLTGKGLKELIYQDTPVKTDTHGTSAPSRSDQSPKKENDRFGITFHD